MHNINIKPYLVCTLYKLRCMCIHKLHYTHDRRRKITELNSLVLVSAVIHEAIIGLYDFPPLLPTLYFFLTWNSFIGIP